MNCEIVGSVCNLTLSLAYQNTTPHPIESSWSWPADSLTSITGMSAIINGVESEGKFMPKESAKEKYADTISSGHTGYMVKYSERKKKIKSTIGNVKPGGEVQMKLKMVKLVEILQDMWTLIVPSKGLEKGVPTELSVEIKSPTTIQKVQSLSHEIVAEISDKSAKVKVNDWGMNDKDFVLKYTNECKKYPTVTPQKDPARADFAYQLSFVPDLGEKMTPGEHIFVLDKSGSMSGTPIRLACEACTMFLQSLPVKSFFNVYLFDSSFSPFFPHSVSYTEENRKKAIDRLRSVSGDGGTNIYEPLEAIFKKELAISDRARFIYLLTDGEVSDKEKVIELIRAQNKTSRVHSFGIGGSVDRDLIVRAARAGLGEAEFISQGEDMTPKVIRALERCVKPALNNVKLIWPEGIKIKHQTSVLEICSGDQLCILAIAEGMAKGNIAFSAINVADNAKVAVDIPISGEPVQGDSLYKLAVSQLINEPNCDEKKKVELSLEYGVLCDKTALFLKEKQESPVQVALTKTELGSLPMLKLDDLRQKAQYKPDPERYMDSRCDEQERCCRLPLSSPAPQLSMATCWGGEDYEDCAIGTAMHPRAAGSQFIAREQCEDSDEEDKEGDGEEG